ncbi:MAG: hypothetical protein ACR2NZ_13230 [Rubripirellula sp.]
MPLLDECCVLIPASTLEDFPSDLSDYDARSLLAAWSVLWHPRLLAQTEQIPVWYRADGPPEPQGKRLFAVPNPSLSQLPDGYAIRAEQNEESTWLTGDSRQAMLDKLALEPCQALVYPGEEGNGSGNLSAQDSGARTIDERDFFAAAYASLQVQVMTRRLRYTSNLDEIHLQTRVVAAAKAFLQGNATEAIEALHDVFDCLAEERDHYFSSDPHLVDLILTSPSTVDSLLTMAGATTDTPTDDPSILSTPVNILIDGEVASAIAKSEAPEAARLQEQLRTGQIGWAGGGPAADACLDAMTLAEAETVFEEAFEAIRDTIGAPPPVYGRFSGSTPSDMASTLVKLGYGGMIPIDFAAGSGFGDEAKVIMQSASGEIEALTAKPIDASSDAAFLGLGARLGEAIDSGEIATALLAHWPGQSCDSFGDLKRVASWSLSLGKFWKLDQYFTEGEHPYHHGTLSAASPNASELLNAMVEAKRPNPISELADQFRDNVLAEQNETLLGMTQLVTGKDIPDGSPPELFAQAIGLNIAERASAQAVLLVNPHSTGVRETVTLEGHSPAAAKHLFAVTRDGNSTTSTVDIPACGFVVVQPSENKSAGEGQSFGKRLKSKLMGGPKPMADSCHLQNEFMEVTLAPETGGISGVYSGGARGNRFSMRLVKCKPLPSGSPADALPGDDTEMRCREHRVVTSTPALGCIEVTGDIIESESQDELASYSLRYTLARGSRTIRIDGKVTPKRELTGKPWEHYIAARAAVATESAICRSLLRDKLHRAKSRRLVAPLGVVLDEAERQTYIGGSGRAFHRRVGDRFLDTLLVTEGESDTSFTLHYGIDLPSPVNAARELMAAPLNVPVQAKAAATEIGWLVHTAPKDVLVSKFRVGRRQDGQLAALVRLVQTRPQQCKATIRFLRDVTSAYALHGSGSSMDIPLPAATSADDSNKNETSSTDDSHASESDSQETRAEDPRPLKCDGDAVSLSLASHGTVDLLVIFADDGSANG